MNIFGKLFNISYTLHNPKNNIVAFDEEIFNRKRNLRLNKIIDDIYRKLNNNNPGGGEQPYNIIIPETPIYVNNPDSVNNGICKWNIPTTKLTANIGDFVTLHLIHPFVKDLHLIANSLSILCKVTDLNRQNHYVLEGTVPVTEWLFLAEQPIVIHAGSIPELPESDSEDYFKFKLDTSTLLPPLKAFNIKYDGKIYVNNENITELITNPNFIINNYILNFVTAVDKQNYYTIDIYGLHHNKPCIQCISETEIYLYTKIENL